MEKNGKVWGETSQLLSNSSVELHKITFLQGKRCSKHLHKHRWNGFYCIAGKLAIQVWQRDYDLVDETILGPGDFCKVKPGLYHRFIGVEDGSALELYWVDGLQGTDIEREDVGGDDID